MDEEQPPTPQMARRLRQREWSLLTALFFTCCLTILPRLVGVFVLSDLEEDPQKSLLLAVRLGRVVPFLLFGLVVSLALSVYTSIQIWRERRASGSIRRPSENGDVAR